jgi:sarcosine oxidase
VIRVRVVVVGGGVIGLLTAVECARAGAQVTLVDRSAIPSPLATSHAPHRMVRALHRGEPGLTYPAARALESWLDVQRLLGVPLYRPIGALTAMAAGEVPAAVRSLAAAGVPVRILPPEELAGWHPRIRFPAGLAGVLEPQGGVVLADRALAALVHWLRSQPAVRLYPHRGAVSVGPGASVRLTGGAVLAADHVVLATGPWSRELMPAALRGGLTLYRQSTLVYAPESLPAWAGLPAVATLGSVHGARLMPPVAGTPVRLSAASACRPVPQMTGRTTPGRWRRHLADLFAPLLPGFDPARVVGSADGYYLAGATGGGPLLAVSADGAVSAYPACGGNSFTFAPLVARALAERAIGRRPRPTGLEAVDHPRQTVADRRGGTAVVAAGGAAGAVTGAAVVAAAGGVAVVGVAGGAAGAVTSVAAGAVGAATSAAVGGRGGRRRTVGRYR